jgi:hypothetical protein
MYSPQSYYGLSPGSPIYFINVARNENQAKNVFFKEFLGHLQNCAWFEKKYDTPSVQAVFFQKNLVALSGNSQAFGWLGYNTLQWVGDEIAFFLASSGGTDDDSGESKAEECWEAAFGSCKTRFPEHYKMIGITTPRYDDDFVMHKFYELKRISETNKSAYAVQKATWEIHPKLTKDDFKQQLERDYRRTMRDFGAVPMGVIETFWGDPEFVDKNVCETCRQCPVYQKRALTQNKYACREYENCTANPYRGNGAFADWFTPDIEADYYMHFDLSKNKDKTAFSLTHCVGWVKVRVDPLENKEFSKAMNEPDPLTEDLSKEEKPKDVDDDEMWQDKPLIKLDFIGWIDPSDKVDVRLLKNGEIYYTGILQYIVMALLKRGFKIAKITADSYNSHMFKQSLEDRGIDTDLLSLDRTDEVPVKAKNCFVENRVEYPYDYIFARESRHLKYLKGNKVDHPTGYGKDVIDSIFGSVYNCEINQTSQVAIEFSDVNISGID